MNQWANKTVLITGASGALGSGLIPAFKTAGASVIALSRTKPRDPLPDVTYRLVDLTDESATSELFASVETPWAVINTVGGFAPRRPLSELDLNEFEKQHTLNLRTAAVITKCALNAMEPQSSGRIIHTASRAATHTRGAGFAYSVSKAGVLHLVRMAAEEYTATDIRIHAVSPEIIDTPANRAAMPDADHSKWATPADIAQAYLFLTAPDSPAKSGTVVAV